MSSLLVNSHNKNRQFAAAVGVRQSNFKEANMFNDPDNRDLDRISLLESRDLVLRAFESLHQRQLNSGKAKEIICHLSQAKAYEKSAEKADETVRPLLQYYSVTAFSKAAILLLSPTLREASLPSKHGLSAVGWKDHLDGGGSLLDARIKTTSGTFSSFGEVTANRKFTEVYLDTGKAKILEIPGTSSYPEEFEFTVGDIFRRLPSVSKLYEAIVQEPAFNWICSTNGRSGSWELTITANQLGVPSPETVAQMLAVEDVGQVEAISTNYYGSGPTPEVRVDFKVDNPELVIPHLNNIVTVNTHPYLIEPFNGNVALSYPSLLLACSYTLGMLVRYYPTYWVSMIQHEKGDAIWPIIRAAFSETTSFSHAISEYF